MKSERFRNLNFKSLSPSVFIFSASRLSPFCPSHCHPCLFLLLSCGAIVSSSHTNYFCLHCCRFLRASEDYVVANPSSPPPSSLSLFPFLIHFSLFLYPTILIVGFYLFILEIGRKSGVGKIVSCPSFPLLCHFHFLLSSYSMILIFGFAISGIGKKEWYMILVWCFLF